MEEGIERSATLSWRDALPICGKVEAQCDWSRGKKQESGRCEVSPRDIFPCQEEHCKPLARVLDIILLVNKKKKKSCWKALSKAIQELCNPSHTSKRSVRSAPSSIVYILIALTMKKCILLWVW